MLIVFVPGGGGAGGSFQKYRKLRRRQVPANFSLLSISRTRTCACVKLALLWL